MHMVFIVYGQVRNAVIVSFCQKHKRLLCMSMGNTQVCCMAYHVSRVRVLVVVVGGWRILGTFLLQLQPVYGPVWKDTNHCDQRTHKPV